MKIDKRRMLKTFEKILLDVILFFIFVFILLGSLSLTLLFIGAVSHMIGVEPLVSGCSTAFKGSCIGLGITGGTLLFTVLIELVITEFYDKLV